MLDQQKGIVLVDFYTQYCPSCTHMMPLYQEVAAEFEGRALLTKVDSSVAKDIAQELRVFAVPVVMAFKDGKLVARFNKALSKKQLIELIERFEKE